MQTVFALEMKEVSFRMAALINMGWAPTVESPISPSSSCLVTRAATDVENHHVDGVRADEGFANLKRLFPG